MKNPVSFRLALTGSVGAGKSTVWSTLKELLPNWAFLSVDELVAQCYDMPAIQASLMQKFGTFDKKELSRRAFSDPLFRVELEYFFELETPLVARIFQFLAQHPFVVVEFPTLFEKPSWISKFDLTAAVIAPAEVRRIRFLQRPGAQLEVFKGIEASQLSAQTKAALADWVLDTSQVSQGRLSEHLRGSLLPLLPTVPSAPANAVPAVEFSPALVRFCNELEFSIEKLESLMSRYNEPHRAYHNVAHLEQMFQAFEQARQQGFASDVDVRALGWALMYHDAVYEVKSLAKYRANEAKSLKLFHADWVAHCSFDSQLLESFHTACELIAATQTHRIDSPFLQSCPKRMRTAALFLDLDMSIFGQSWPQFLQYHDGIAKEWQHFVDISEQEFNDGRAKVLSEFLAEKQLYLSEFGARFESLARSNLQRVLHEQYGA